MTLEKKPDPIMVRLGYQLNWYRNIECDLTDVYPIERTHEPSNLLDDMPPWIRLKRKPRIIDGSRDIYSVFDLKPLIHREFACIDENDPECIKAFVIMYGLLGVSPALSDQGYYMETVIRWQHEIREMRGILTLLDLCKYENDESFREYIHRVKVNRVFTFHWRRELHEKKIYSGQPYQTVMGESWSAKTVKNYVLDYVLEKVAQLRCGYNPVTSSMDYEPLDLLSAMWVMFLYHEIISKVEIRYCQHCGEAFKVQRSDQKYCTKRSTETGTTRCRVAAYRAGFAKPKRRRAT